MPFWLLDPVLGARIRPGFRGLDPGGFEVEINSLGLRNPEIEVQKPQGRLRILALGDSVTYGFGVTADEAFPRILEGELERRGLCDVEVVNAGILGYSTYQGAAFLERDLLALEPDVVLFAFMNNDRWDARGQVHTARAIQAEFERKHLRWWLFCNTALGRIAVRSQVGGLNGVLETPERRRKVAEQTIRRQSQPVVVVPEPLQLEPVAADDERLGELARLGQLVPTVSLTDRRRYCERVAVLAAQHGFRLVFVNFYDHPYMCEPLRRAHEQLEGGEAQAALESLVEYFRTPPIKNTSARRLMSYDLIANEHLSRVYDALGRPPEDRQYYFPRPKNAHLIVDLDIECNGVSTEVAARNGADVVDFRDLVFEDYLDHIHLSPQGHRAVAERLAEILVERPTAGPSCSRK